MLMMDGMLARFALRWLGGMIYRNGVLEADKVGMTPFENINYDLLLGDGFAGLLDEVRIYDRALSATEVLSLYKASDSR